MVFAIVINVSEVKMSECCVRNCCHTCPLTKDTHLFRFLKDKERAKQWGEVCGLLPLVMNKLQFGFLMSNSSYKVCSRHFPDSAYRGESRKRLCDDAVPTLMLNKEDQITRHPLQSTSNDENLPSEEVVMQQTYKDDEVPPSHSVGNQTPITLSAHSPRKKKLWDKIKTLQRQVNRLKLQLRKEREKKSTSIADLSNHDWERLLYERFPPAIAAFIYQQYKLNTKSKGVRYSVHFKYFCLKIYFLSPKAYSFLKSCFKFPSKRTLSRMTTR
nr:uncharacterized protein LOC111413078 [Onthophagus taurus]